MVRATPGIEALREMRRRDAVTGNALLARFRRSTTIAPARPPGYDDSHDVAELVGPLSDSTREELGLPRISRRPPPGPEPAGVAAPTPLYTVQVHAVVCRDDDGSGLANNANVIDTPYLEKLLAATSAIYAGAGVRFTLAPAPNLETVSSTLLNREFTVPPNLDLTRPESKSPLVDVDTVAGGQSSWRWCAKCHGLFFSATSGGVCPAGGAHNQTDATGTTSWDYSLIHDRALDGAQAGWRWCSKCQGLAFGGNQPGTCPAGGQHNHGGSGDYWLLHNRPRLESDTEPDPSWRWCTKCQGLFSVAQNNGTCPAGGAHDPSGSGAYTLSTQLGNLTLPHLLARQELARARRHRLVLLLSQGVQLKYDGGWKVLDARTYAFSGGQLEFVAIGPLKWADIKAHAYLMAHEIGHYFHLAHTHGPLPSTIAEAATLIRDAVDGGKVAKADGATVFDFDRHHGVKDTVADPGDQLLTVVNSGGDNCGPVGTVDVPVTFADGSKRTYPLAPDRGNSMSYFKHCTSFSAGLSTDQGKRIRAAIEVHQSFDLQNRWHTCHPAMRLSVLAPYVTGGQTRFAALWRPGAEAEIQVYDWPLAQLRAKYDELWPQGWRLNTLAPYVTGGAVRYAAVWRPSTEAEIQVYDWPLAQLRAKYDELWPQGWRLKLLSPYVTSSGVRFAAVWRPSTEGEIQVYDWPLAQLRAKYDELWPQGWRLNTLAPYLSGNTVRYAATWRPSTESEIQVYDWPQAQLRAKYDELWPQGWRLNTLAPYLSGNTVRYAATWRPSTESEIQVYDWPQAELRSQYDKFW